MRIGYKVVNPTKQQCLLEYKLEEKFIKCANYCPGINGIKKLRLPLQAFFPEFEESGEFNQYHFYQYVINDDYEVYCYETYCTEYDKDEYSLNPLRKAVLIHKFNITRK